jgi:hypothetical protein
MADINSHIVHDNYDLDGQTPQAIVTGEAPDISRLAEFSFYQWIECFDQDAAMAEDQEKYGRYLGPSRDVGSLMTSKILNDKGNNLYRSTFRALTQDDLDPQKEKAIRDKFDKDVECVLGDAFDPGYIPEDDTPEHELYEDDEVGKVETVDRDDYDKDAIDLYLKAEVTLPIAGEMKTGIVERRKRDRDGNLIGKANHNPILDTRLYTVKFPDGKEAEYAPLFGFVVGSTQRRLQRAGSFVWNGRMVLHHGFPYQHLRSQILWR